MNGGSRAVLITGCSSGIGRAAADTLRERGYRTLATARRARDVERLAAVGHESLQLDVTDAQSIDAALDEILARTGGRLYGLFNNAGFGQPGAVEDLTVDVLRAQFETNVFGWQAVIRRVLPVMRAAGRGANRAEQAPSSGWSHCPIAAPTSPPSSRSRPSPTRCGSSCAAAESTSR